MKLTIKKANNNDLQQIIKLIEYFYATHNDKLNLNKYDNDLVDIEKNYFPKKGYFWVAESPQKAIIATITIQFHTNNSAELKRLYVEKKYQRQGIATLMLKKAINKAKEMNYNKIFLWTDKRYLSAQLFYKHWGFIQTRQTTFYDADEPWEALLFEKEI